MVNVNNRNEDGREIDEALPVDHPSYFCDRCMAYHAGACPPEEDIDIDDDPDACTDPGGHSWVYTGTAYGGDDPSYLGEGRCYCEHCGADGDG
jgi:hypothetical protein